MRVFRTRLDLIWTSALYIGVVFLLVSALSERHVETGLLLPFRSAVAAAAVRVLSPLGVVAARQGASIVAPGLSVEIVNECTGLEAMILLVAAVAVFPASLRAKSVGLLLSLVVMATINFVRIVSLCYVGTYSATGLNIGHLYVWPAAVIISGLGTLLFWVENFVATEH